MEKIVPVLQIDDAEIAKDFYLNKLGFVLDFEWRHEPGFPVFMGVEKGDLYLHLSEHGKGHSGTEVYVFVKDISVWHSRCLQYDVVLDHEPQKMPWGNTDMLVVDPFRNSLRFSQIGTHEPTAASA